MRKNEQSNRRKQIDSYDKKPFMRIQYLYWKFMCTDQDHGKNKKNLLSPTSIQ